MKLDEDWISVLAAFALIALGVAGVLNPVWVRF
jgi:hypothetical protein